MLFFILLVLLVNNISSTVTIFADGDEIYDFFHAFNNEYWTDYGDFQALADNSTFIPSSCSDLDQSSSNIVCELDGITQYISEIKVAWKNLAGTFPTSISNFYKLKKLDLRGNGNINFPFPSEFYQLQHLEYLDISQMTLSGQPTIPEDLGLLTSLTKLNLENSNFKGVIPSSFANLTSLTWLNIHHNSIHDIEADTLCNMTALSYINFSNNQFNTTSFANCFHHLKANLEHLILDHNSISGHFPSTIWQCTKLKVITLKNNLFNFINFADIKDEMTDLTELSLSYNQFYTSINSTNFDKLSSLQFLRLDHNQFYGSIESNLFNYLADTIIEL